MSGKKSIIEKSQEMEVNPYYDMNLNEVGEIIKNSPTQIDMVATGFAYGYRQGVRAEQSQTRKIRKEEPKNTDEYRRGITANIYGIRSKVILKEIYQLTKAQRLYWNEKTYNEISEAEKRRLHIVGDLMKFDSGELDNVDLKTI